MLSLSSLYSFMFIEEPRKVIEEPFLVMVRLVGLWRDFYIWAFIWNGDWLRFGDMVKVLFVIRVCE